MALNQIPGHNLYIGGLLALRNKAALSKANITHVVSVLRMQPDESAFASYRHLAINVDDVPDENLLEHFATANAFIQAGIDSGGSVLVHCAMGKSRSATICVAYLLHRQPAALNPDRALAIVRAGRPMCEPNEGFMAQLALYHQMGCPHDVTSHPLYQRWLSNREIEESVACGRAPEVESVRFEDELSPPSADPAEKAAEVRCRKCRRTLATTDFVISHEPENHTASSQFSRPDCAHIFLHPLTWMRPCLFPGSTSNRSKSASDRPDYGSQTLDEPLSGRLTCPSPSCGSNVGKFAWQGMQCTCGQWVVPAMAIARARVDIVEKRAQEHLDNVTKRLGSMGIRLPPHMRSDIESSPSKNTEKGNL